MAREIAIKEEYLSGCDDSVLTKVMRLLHKEFLFIDLGDYRIEVNEVDYSAITRALSKLQQDIESKR